MSLDELIRTAARRWYVVLPALALALLWSGALLRPQPTYHAQMDLVMVLPGAAATDGISDARRESLVAFAGVVEREMNDGAPVTRLSSASASLFGAGVRQGSSVSVPNVGGQWTNSFTRPVLSVEAVDSTPEQVTARLAVAEARVETLVESLQAEQGAAPADRIQVVRVPQEPPVSYVGATKSGLVRAGLALGLLSVGAALLLAVTVDRRIDRRVRSTVDFSGPAGAV
ncbi:hypothetical protein [uncultured Cellulomonas sp.]|uniref:hypothetical protein n=1 Tax=uncultured Cellulomonas sp. TaxID=189682 RepID=UPI002634E776|nr:hypothetical protein [uncultured Cellulomonas sp.]